MSSDDAAPPTQAESELPGSDLPGTAVPGTEGAGPEVVAPSLRQMAWLLRELVRRHPGLFSAAVGGAMVYAACTVLSSVMVRLMTDRVIVPRFDRGGVRVATVIAVLTMVVAVAVVRATGVVLRRTFAARAAWRTAQDITSDVVGRLIAQPVPWHRRQSIGDLITRAGVDAEAATMVMHPLPFATSVVALVIGSAVWLLVTDIVLGLIAVALFPALIAVNVVYQRRVDRHYQAAQFHLGELSSAAHESFEGVTVVKSFGAEHRETQRLAEYASRVRSARLRVVEGRSMFEALLELIPNLANVVLLVAGAYRVRSGDLTLGELASFVYLFTLLVFPLRLIGFALSDMPHSMAGYRRITNLLDEPLDPDPALGLQAPTDAAVRLAHVTYRHDADRDVIDDVTATVDRGAHLAVVGATGAGKTTLLHLLAGLIAPQHGRVEVPVATTRLVFQEPFLLAGSVRDNICLGRSISDDQLREALEIAEATFCYDLPQQLDTVIGERGVGLSGGQRQRIALARAIVDRPSVLLLDDTTSALDPLTETQVLANIERGLTDTTVVAVASRPSSILLADEVLYLSHGRVRAQGVHRRLMDEVPEYRALIQAFEHDRAEGRRGGERGE